MSCMAQTPANRPIAVVAQTVRLVAVRAVVLAQAALQTAIQAAIQAVQRPVVSRKAARRAPQAARLNLATKS